MRFKPVIAATALGLSALFLPGCRGKDPVEPARRALAAYAAAVDAFAARADAVSDAASAAAAVQELTDALRPAASSIRALGRDFPDLGDPASSPPRLKADVEAAEAVGNRLAAAMAKIMAWGDAPPVRAAVARLAEVEALLR